MSISAIDRASSREIGRPSESVRRAVLRHAADLAAERASARRPVDIDFKQRAANQSWRRPAAYGGLAAAVLAGLLIAPRFLTPSSPTQEIAKVGPPRRYGTAHSGRADRHSRPGRRQRRAHRRPRSCSLLRLRLQQRPKYQRARSPEGPPSGKPRAKIGSPASPRTAAEAPQPDRAEQSLRAPSNSARATAHPRKARRRRPPSHRVPDRSIRSSAEPL